MDDKAKLAGKRGAQGQAHRTTPHGRSLDALAKAAEARRREPVHPLNHDELLAKAASVRRRQR